MTIRSPIGHRAFTLFEVLATTLLVGIGLMALVAVIMYAMSRALAMQAACTGTTTAMCVAYDSQPLLPPETTADWTSSSISVTGSGTETATSSGWVNGYWVVRKEYAVQQDTFGAAAPNGGGWTITPGKARSCEVTVQVYEGSVNGRLVGSFTTRILKQGAP